MINIDGSSGGGQILRTAIGLSMVTGKPFEMEKVRGGRKKPGLKTQHLEGLKAAAELCGAEVSGAKMGSTTVVFEPGDVDKKHLTVDIATAGSIGLVFQTLQLVPYSLEDTLKVRVRGGATYGKWAPPLDYLRHVFLKVMENFSYSAKFKINRHGFYPKGGADVEFVLEQWKPEPIELTEPGDLTDIEIQSVAAEALRDADVAKRQAKAAKHALNANGFKATDNYRYTPAANPGSGIVCFATLDNTVLGGDAVGEKGVRSEKVGENAARELIGALNKGSPLDRWMSDMILPFVALAGGKVRIHEKTHHVQSNIETIEKFLDVEISIRDGLVTVV